jgi:hypothetical protein
MKVPNGITNYRRTIIYRFAITSVQSWASSLNNISIVCVRFRDYGNGTFCMSHPFLNSHWSIHYGTCGSYIAHFVLTLYIRFLFLNFHNTLLACAWLFDKKENARRPCPGCLKLCTYVCHRRDHELTTWTRRLSLRSWKIKHLVSKMKRKSHDWPYQLRKEKWYFDANIITQYTHRREK